MKFCHISATAQLFSFTIIDNIFQSVINVIYYKAKSYNSKYTTNTTQQIYCLRKVIKNSYLSPVGHEMEP